MKACRCFTRLESTSRVRASGVRCISASTAWVTSASLRMIMSRFPPGGGKSSSAAMAALTAPMFAAATVRIAAAALVAAACVASTVVVALAAMLAPRLRRAVLPARLRVAHRVAILLRGAAGGRHRLVLLHDRPALRFRNPDMRPHRDALRAMDRRAVLPFAGYDVVVVAMDVNRPMDDADVAVVPVGRAVEEAVRDGDMEGRPWPPEDRTVVRPPPPWAVDDEGIVVAHIDDLGARLDHDSLALLVDRRLVAADELAVCLRPAPQALHRVHDLRLLAEERFPEVAQPLRALVHARQQLREGEQRLDRRVPRLLLGRAHRGVAPQVRVGARKRGGGGDILGIGRRHQHLREHAVGL